MQHYTIFFIAVNALHVSGGFSAHHKELKLYVQFELLMMGGKTAWNIQSIDSNEDYCITLHPVGYA